MDEHRSTPPLRPPLPRPTQDPLFDPDTALPDPTGAEPPAGWGQEYGCVAVLADPGSTRSGVRTGVISYRVPRGMSLGIGDEVTVPLGASRALGIVLGPGEPTRASRAVSGRWGRRADPAQIELARALARKHFVDFAAVAPRLAPRRGRNARPVEDATLTALPSLGSSRPTAGALPRRCALLPAPLLDAFDLAAEHALRLSRSAPGAQVLVLAPTGAHIDSFLRRFSAGAQRLDSKAPAGAWRGFSEGRVALGVGTRAAVLYGAPALAGIIVLDADHPGHQEALQPAWNAATVAAERARVQDLELVMISALPAPGVVGELPLVAAGGRRDWPAMRIHDRASFSWEVRSFPPPVLAAIRKASKSGSPALVLAQRSPSVRRCSRCGEIRTCESCDASSCSHQATLPCPRCAGLGLRRSGWDAERLTAEFGELVEVVSFAELTTRRDAGCVVLPDLDSALRVPSLRPGDLAASIVLAAARAAGAGGVVHAMTNDPSHPLLSGLFGERDLVALAQSERAAAAQAGLPPFGTLLELLVAGEDPPDLRGVPGFIHGPRRVGPEWQVLVRAHADEDAALLTAINRIRRSSKLRLRRL